MLLSKTPVLYHLFLHAEYQLPQSAFLGCDSQENQFLLVALYFHIRSANDYIKHSLNKIFVFPSPEIQLGIGTEPHIC